MSIKVPDNFGGDSADPKHGSGAQFMNVILPLACIVESSSWVLFGTPVYPIKNTVSQDHSSKWATEAANQFKNSILLGSLTPKNFKIYSKQEESSSGQPDPNTSLKGSLLGGGFHNSNVRNEFLLVSNVSKLGINLPKVDIMFILN